MAVGRMAKAAAQGAKLAIKYGPQAKIAWDKGGKQATAAATKRALTLNNRRRAVAHASGVIERHLPQDRPPGQHRVRRVQRRAAHRGVPAPGAALPDPAGPRGPRQAGRPCGPEAAQPRRPVDGAPRSSAEAEPG
ncbi:MAG: hypothetical protein R2731_06095 [Nocardioides sp.]